MKSLHFKTLAVAGILLMAQELVYSAPKLCSPEIENETAIFYNLLKLDPTTIVKMDVTSGKLKKQLDEIKKSTFSPQELHTRMNDCLKPFGEFIAHIKMVNNIIDPIICFSACGLRLSDNDPNRNNYFLLKFLASSVDFQKFIQEQINNNVDAQKLCVELITFIADIKAALPNDLRERYEKIRDELRNQHKK